MRRVWEAVLGVVAALALVAASMWWWDLTSPLPFVQALYPAIVAGVVGIAAVATLSRARVAGVLALGAVVVCAVAVLPTLLPVRTDAGVHPAVGGPSSGTARVGTSAGAAGNAAPGAAEPSGGSRFTVLALNTEFGTADMDRIRQVVAERRPDVVVFTEAGPEFRTAARDALGSDLPHDSGPTVQAPGGTLIMSHLPMTVLDRDDAARPVFQQPIVRLSAGDRTILLRGVHPRSPASGGRARPWRADLAALADWQRRQDGPLVLAGDFNAAWPHPGFRSVTDGLDDALRATGQAWSPTWPTTGPVPAFTQIDHVLTRGCTVSAAGTVAVPGTDHLGVWADLALR